MLAFTVSNKKLKAVEKPFPKVLAGWALVRVRMAGICNTDVEILRGYHDFRGVPGHEFVGEVVRAGSRRWLESAGLGSGLRARSISIARRLGTNRFARFASVGW